MKQDASLLEKATQFGLNALRSNALDKLSGKIFSLVLVLMVFSAYGVHEILMKLRAMIDPSIIDNFFSEYPATAISIAIATLLFVLSTIKVK